jgi:hypothetical protein
MNKLTYLPDLHTQNYINGIGMRFSFNLLSKQALDDFFNNLPDAHSYPF